MDSASFCWSRLVVAVTLAVLSLSAAQAENCTSESVAPECLMERSQAGLEQADGELNRTYQKVLKAMSRPRDEYVDYPALKAKFVEAQRQWVRFLSAECSAWYLINEAGADRNLDLPAKSIERVIARAN